MQSLLQIKQEKLPALLSFERDEKRVEDVLMVHALFTPSPWSYNKLPGGAFPRLLHLFFCNTLNVQVTTPVKPVAELLLAPLSLLGC